MTSIDEFRMQNTVSYVTKPDDYHLPEELVSALNTFIDTCFDYRVDGNVTHYINQLTDINKQQPIVSLSSISGVKSHVINTMIRTNLIRRTKELADKMEREGGSFGKKLYL